MNFLSLAKMMRGKTPVAATVILTCLASPSILAKAPEGLTVGPPALHGGGGPQNIKTPTVTQSLIPVGNNAVASIVQQTASNAALKAVIKLSSPPSSAQGNGPADPIQRGAPGSAPSLLVGASNSSAAAGQSNTSLNGANAASSMSNSGIAGSGNASNPVITNSKGEVLLVAGKSVELMDPGTPELRVEVTAPENQALNLGKIIADSGGKGIYAGLAWRGDVRRAEHAAVTSDGRVLLRSTQNIVPTTGETGTEAGAVRNNAAGSSGKNAEPMRVASASPQGNDSHGGSTQGKGALGQASQGSSAHGGDSIGGSSQGGDSQRPAPQGNGGPFEWPVTGSDADEAEVVAAEQKQGSGATAAESAGRKSNVCS